MTIVGRKGLIAVAIAAVLTTAGCSTPVDPSEFDQASPAIAGNVVVWEDSRNAESTGTDIYLYDTYNATETSVTRATGDQTQPVISDRYIAWIDQGRLRAMDRQTGSVFSVTNGAATQADPALCGTVVTWTDTRNGAPDVYARNLAGGSEVAVATSSAVEAYPACDQSRVVYMYAPTGQWATIRMYDLNSHQTTVVANAPYNEWMPAISGNRVVWQAWPNQPDTTTGIQIYGKDLGTGQTFTVSAVLGNQTAPTISGSVVAWEDTRNGTPRVWWRDLADGTTTQRPADPEQTGQQEVPALSGRLLAYQSDDTGPWNVYTVPLIVPGSTTTATAARRQLHQCSSIACERRLQRRLAARFGDSVSRQLLHYLMGLRSRGRNQHASL